MKNSRTAARRKQKPTHERTRTQRIVNSSFIWRRHLVANSADHYGSLVPLTPEKRDKVHDLMVYSPQHWHVVAIAYCLDAQGGSYRSFSEQRTTQRIAARNIATNEDQITPLLEATLDAATSGVNPRQIVDTAIIMRPWSAQQPSMQRVMQTLQESLSLTDDEVQGWEPL